MFKSKGAVLGVALAIAASVLVIAGLAVNTTAGAATDYPNESGGGPSGSLTAPGATTPGNPPASPVEPPATVPVTNPDSTTIDPTGGEAGANALPNAGFGPGASTDFGSLMIMLGTAGLIFAGAGATLASRRK